MLSDPETAGALRPLRRGRRRRRAAGGPNLGDMFGGGGLGDLFDAFFGGGWQPVRRWRPWARPARRAARTSRSSPTSTFEQAVFGATVAGHRAHRGALRRLRRHGRRPGHAAGDVLASATVAARCSGCARACSARWSPPAPCPRCGGLGQVIVTPCPTCSGDGRLIADKTYQVDVPAGVDTGSTLRLSGRGAVGPRGGRGRRPVRPHPRRRPRDVHPRRRRSRRTCCRSRSPRPRWAPRSCCRRSTARRRSSVPAGTQPGREFVFRQRGRAPAARPRSRRPARAGQRAGADEADRVRDGAAAQVRRVARRAGRRHRARVCSRGSNPPSREPGAARVRRGARFRRRRSPSPVLSDEDDHHLASGAARPRRRGRHRQRRVRPVGDGTVDGSAAVTVESEPTTGRRRRAAATRHQRDSQGRPAGMDRAEADRGRCDRDRLHRLRRAAWCGGMRPERATQLRTAARSRPRSGDADPAGVASASLSTSVLVRTKWSSRSAARSPIPTASRSGPPTPTRLLVGPEGGFTDG